MRAGRPLRFLVTVMAGWIGVRTVLLWPERVTQTAAASAPASLMRDRPALTSMGSARAEMTALPISDASTTTAIRVAHVGRLAPLPVASMSRVGMPVIKQEAAQSVPPIEPRGSLPTPIGAPDRPAESRWSGSLFAIARPSGSGGGLGSSQLGGSQVGARIAYALDAGRQFALVGRVATPLEGRGREAALGVEWRPPGMPVRLFAEQRVALDGGRGGPSVGAIAGFNRLLGPGFRLEAYGQAGAIKRDRIEGFADGAARITRRVAAIGPATLDIGAGTWGGAQRGAERLDVGPTVGVAAPIAGRTLRLTVDWRERIVGDARPGSGPALSIGTDF